MTLPFAEWLPQQRWYAGRARTLSSVKEASSTRLGDNVDLVLIDVEYTDGSSERYQVIVAWDNGPIAEFSGVATIGTTEHGTGYDALYDQGAARYLLSLVEAGGTSGDVVFTREPAAEFPGEDAYPRVFDAERRRAGRVRASRDERVSPTPPRIPRGTVHGARPELLPIGFSHCAHRIE